MKKFTSLLLALLITASCTVGCSQGDSPTPETEALSHEPRFTLDSTEELKLKVTELEQELSNLRTDYNNLYEEYQSLMATSVDQKTKEYFELILLIKKCVYECRDYHSQLARIDLDNYPIYDQSGYLREQLDEKLEVIKESIHQLRWKGDIHRAISWILLISPNASDEEKEQLGLLEYYLSTLAYNLEAEVEALQGYCLFGKVHANDYSTKWQDSSEIVSQILNKTPYRLLDLLDVILQNTIFSTSKIN
jgi:hypothetical protein